MEYVGKYVLDDDNPDNYGEVVKFFHPKFPEWRVIIESRMPYRDNLGMSRGTVNPDTALTVQFAGKMFVTNSSRVINALRSLEVYRGRKSPAYIARLKAEGSKSKGFIEIDPIEEKLLIERDKMEQELRARLHAEADAKEAEVADVTPQETVIIQEEVEEPETIVAGKFCPDCGTPASSKFCPNCGTELATGEAQSKPKKTWACDQCDMVFSSGFKLGDHKKKIHVVREPTGPEMIVGGHGTGNIGGVL